MAAIPTPVFPGAVATEEDLKVGLNLISTTLKVGCSATDEILFVVDSQPFGANILVSIDTEIIAIFARNVTTPQLFVAPGGRGFDGTTAAAHSAGAKVSMHIVAWHHNALSQEIQAIEQFLGPNGQNLSGGGLGILNVHDYNFAPQQPGGSLVPGNNAIMLAPVPAGVNGTNQNHYLWISSGTGAPEAVKITGGSAVSGALSGTVIVNCANAHSGAWTIGSATGGAQEAIYAMPQSTGTIVFGVNGQPTTLHATISAPAAGYITFRGQGVNFPAVLRSSEFRNGDLFLNGGTACSLTFQDLGISQGGGAQTGAGIHFDHPTSGQFLYNTFIVNGQYGYRISGGRSIIMIGCYYTQVDQSFQVFAGVDIVGVGMLYMTSCQFVGVSGNPNMVQFGISIHSEPGEPVDGMWISNTLIDGVVPINIVCNGSFLTNIQMTGCQIDGAEGNGIVLGGAGGFFSDLQFTGMHINLQSGNGWAGNGSGVDIGFSSPSSCDNIQFVGGYISGAAGPGVSIGRTGAKSIAFKGVAIRDNNRANNPNHGGIFCRTGVTGLSVVGCDIYNESGVAGHQKFGITSEGTLAGTIVGNDLSQNELGPIAITTSFTGVIANNKGIGFTNGLGPALVSAATITPTHQMHHVTGAAAISTIAAPPGFISPTPSNGYQGTELTLIPDAAFTWTASGNIAVAGAATANVPITFFFDPVLGKWFKMD